MEMAQRTNGVIGTTLLPANLAEIGKDAVYEIVDLLLSNKTTIERGLRDQEATLFPRKN